MKFAIFYCMPLDSRLRGNDEIKEDMEIKCLNCTNCQTKTKPTKKAQAINLGFFIDSVVLKV